MSRAKLFVIGNPIGHSLSPILHKIVFEKYGIDATYEKINVEPTDLDDFVSNVGNDVIGFNVTVPYKTQIMPYLRGISPEAAAINAVNTVCVKEGKMYGYNTDCLGFVMQLRNDGVSVAGKNVVVIGSGGASNGVCYGLFSMGARKICVYNRTFEKAKSLADKFSKFGDIVPFELKNFSLDGCDILVNTTSSGLKCGDTPVKIESMDNGIIVYDIIYNPRETELLKVCKRCGCEVYNGLDMLIYQGLCSDEIWFGKKFSKDKVLINKIRMELENRL